MIQSNIKRSFPSLNASNSPRIIDLWPYCATDCADFALSQAATPYKLLAATNPVATAPGQSAVTVTPLPDTSCATAWLNEVTKALVA